MTSEQSLEGSSQSQPSGAPKSAATEGATSAACDCIAQMDAKLREHNGAIVCTMFGKPPRAAVEVYQVETGRGKRRPPKAIASFCPFCGEAYDKAVQS